MLPEQDQRIESLYHEYFPKLTAYAVAVLHNTDRAQEVVQDTFHEAILHIDTIMIHENPGGWLMVTLKNKIKNHERARRRYIRRFLSLDTDISEIAISSNTELLINQVEQSDILLLKKIESALKPDEYKRLKRLVIDRATHLQVSREFGISVYASEKRLERIRKKLHKLLPKEDE